ncbi:MAG: tetratricopeptide repeat protein [Phycisphaeraceae bacterium]|nr:tetratricopeptide repeat protein [Phycisphaeraceae bacterium]
MQDLSIKLAPARDHMNAGRFDKAAALLQRLAQQHPKRPDVLALLIISLVRSGKAPQAQYYVDQARAMSAGDARALLDLGNLLAKQAQGEMALPLFEAALAIDPTLSAASVGLSGSHFHAYRLGDTIATARAGLEHNPTHPMLLCNLGVSLLQAGRPREALDVLSQAAAANPDHELIVAAHAACTNYAGNATPKRSYEAHRMYDALLNRQLPTPPRPKPRDPNPDRPLRVGVVSADLRAHPCGSFIEPWLASHSKGFEITCYSVAFREDAASKRLRGHPVRWKWEPTMHAKDFADMLARDQIDVVLELSGLTAGHRMIALHLRPAPVQVTYFGYPNTTGLSAIDARIVDSITDPDDPSYNSVASERLVRMDPCFLCFPPIAGAPEPGPLPAKASGHVTFGSFNNVAKIDDDTIRMWTRAVLAVPASRLLLKYHALSQAPVRDAIIERFVKAGLPADRIELDPPGKNTLDTLAAYQRVDIALDTYPYHGTTTTCEALFMGCPVVTRMGDRCVARVSGSILAAAGIDDCTADTDDGFVEIARRLTGDLDGLAARRAGLREKILASTLCDQRVYVERLERTLRALWKDVCAAA